MLIDRSEEKQNNRSTEIGVSTAQPRYFRKDKHYFRIYLDYKKL